MCNIMQYQRLFSYHVLGLLLLSLRINAAPNTKNTDTEDIIMRNHDLESSIQASESEFELSLMKERSEELSHSDGALQLDEDLVHRTFAEDSYDIDDDDDDYESKDRTTGTLSKKSVDQPSMDLISSHDVDQDHRVIRKDLSFTSSYSCSCGKGCYTTCYTVHIYCDPGNYGPSGYDTCWNCPVGTYQPNYGQTSCLSCPAGQYMGYTGASYCATCSGGYYCPQDSVYQTACPAGYYCPAGSTEPVACPEGSYNSDTAQPWCQNCPGGKYISSTASTSCVDCRAGYYCPSGSSSAIACPSGQYQSSLSSSSCTNCPAGSKCASTAMELYTSCPSGQYQDLTAQTTCKTCPGGYYCPSGSSTYKGCTTAGKYCPSGSSSASKCPTGQYNSGTYQSSCNDCPGGQYQASIGSTNCDTCPGGYYCPSGSSTYQGCTTAGKYCPSGSSSASKCPTGQYNSGTYQSSCNDCPGGQYQTSTGQTSCSTCPSGYYCPSGAKSPTDCPSGNYCQSGVASYVGCPQGQYNPATIQSSCLTCPSGDYCIGSGSDSTACPSGSYSDSGASSCLDCAIGQYSASSGTASCTDCGAGKYQTSEGQTSCINCPVGFYCSVGDSIGGSPCSVGKYTANTGASSCTGCGAGKYTASTGSSSCTNCPGGRYQPSTGQISCEVCPGSYYCPVGSSTTVNCPAGNYCPSGSETSLTCPKSYYCPALSHNGTICPKGYYCLNGSSTPTTCPKGYYCETTGLSEYSPCIVGKYSSAGAESCSSCSEGYYQALEAQSDCTSCPAGYYCSGTAQSSYTGSCAVGQYAPIESVECFDCKIGRFQNESTKGFCYACSPGYYQDSIGQTSCTDYCLAGNYAPSGSSACKGCDAGKYQPADIQGSCDLCKAGFYQANQGQTSCVECEVGKLSQAHRQYCADCPSGTYVFNQSACNSCPLGTYAATALENECDSCGSGYYTNNITGATSCTACDAGYYSVGLAAECSVCNAGSWSGNAASSCSLCENGTISEAGKSTCSSCPQGKYSQHLGGISCTSCALGKYQPASGQTSCYSCSAGFSTLNVKSEATTCAPCDTGTFALLESVNCTTCEAGTYSGTAATQCVACEKGKYQIDAGQPSCDNCEAGKYAESNFSTSCFVCPAGKSQSAAGQWLCTECAAGKSNNYSGSDGNNAITCTSCPAGSHSSLTGSDRCSSCEAGKYSSESSPECTNCTAGYQSSQGASTCTACDAGSYAPRSGLSSCTNCAKGYSQGASGQSYCDTCEKGKYAADQGSTSCTFCSSGSFAMNQSASGCVLCEKGKYQGSTGQSGCDNCDVGKYASTTGSMICDSCEAGTFAPVISSMNCTICDRGTYSASRASVCIECSSGFSTDNQKKATSCTSCAAGKMASQTGSSNCSSCPVGTYSSERSSSCVACSPGFASASYNSIGCEACAAGKYAINSSSSKCVQCETGKSQGATGQAWCVQCVAGKISAELGSTSCDSCAAGKYAHSEGLANCTYCEKGTYSSEGSSICSECETGFSTNGKKGANSCASCVAGKFANTTGTSKCYNCRTGTYSSERAADCIDCPSGFYTAEIKSTSCTACSAGSFASSTASSECFLCPQGRTQGSTGQSSCIACDAGKAINELGTTSCTSCEAGKYATSVGSVNCTQCDPGSTSSEGALECTACLPGYYASDYGATTCTACSAGKATSDIGSSICDDCEAGYHQSATGQTTCDSCDAGKFTSSSSQTSCEYCSTGKDSGIGSTSCSLALPDYFVIPLSTDDGEAVATVFECPSEGVLCTGNQLLPAVSENYWIDREYLSGYYSDASAVDSNTVHPYKCLRKTCIGAIEINYTNPNCIGVTTSTSTGTNCEVIKVPECWIPEGLTSNLCDDDELQCATGSRGRLCGSCKNNYYYSGVSSLCLQCTRKGLLNTALIVIIGIVFSLLLWMTYPFLTKSNHFISFLGMLKHLDMGSLKILFSTYQIAQSVAYTIDVKFPSPFSNMLELIYILNFDFGGLQCAGFGVHQVAYIMSFIPIAIGICLIVLYFFHLIIASSKNERIKISAYYAWLLLFLSYLVLPPVTMVQFQSLVCIDFYHDHSRYLRIDTIVNCDSKGHQEFVFYDICFIFIYLTIPILWLFLLLKYKSRLLPFGVKNEILIIEMRRQDEHLKPLRFLYECYRPHMFCWEVLEIYRRILFVCAVPLISTKTLERAAIGLALSLMSIFLYREASPFVIPSTNILAYLAQIVLFLIYGGAVVIETDLSRQMDGFTLGILLCFINSVVVSVALLSAWFRHRRERLIILQRREKMITKVEMAFEFNANKFENLFLSIEEHSLPSTHCLIFHYNSLIEIESFLLSGIPSQHDQGGIVFTIHRPNDLTENEKDFFISREAVIVCSLPRSLLYEYDEIGEKSLRILPNSILSSMRSHCYDEIRNKKLWSENVLLLPPTCIVKSYQLIKDSNSIHSQSQQQNHYFQHFIQKKCFKMKQICSKMICLRNDLSNDEYNHFSFDKSIDLYERCFEIIPIGYCLQYIAYIQKIRLKCKELGLIPVYHYTNKSVAQFVMKSGFRMSNNEGMNALNVHIQGSQVGGDGGGVYFSTLGPCSYELGSPQYEDNIIIDCFGKERLEEYRGKHKLDVCLVYGIDPYIIEQAPGGRDNAKYVPKMFFEDFSLPHSDGNYFLRPDRLFGAFEIDPLNPPSNSQTIENHMDTDLSIKNEALKDFEVSKLLDRVENYMMEREKQTKKFIEEESLKLIKMKIEKNSEASKRRISIGGGGGGGLVGTLKRIASSLSPHSISKNFESQLSSNFNDTELEEVSNVSPIFTTRLPSDHPGVHSMDTFFTDTIGTGNTPRKNNYLESKGMVLSKYIPRLEQIGITSFHELSNPQICSDVELVNEVGMTTSEVKLLRKASSLTDDDLDELEKQQLQPNTSHHSHHHPHHHVILDNEDNDDEFDQKLNTMMDGGLVGVSPKQIKTDGSKMTTENVVIESKKGERKSRLSSLDSTPHYPSSKLALKKKKLESRSKQTGVSSSLDEDPSLSHSSPLSSKDFEQEMTTFAASSSSSSRSREQSLSASSLSSSSSENPHRVTRKKPPTKARANSPNWRTKKT